VDEQYFAAEGTTLRDDVTAIVPLVDDGGTLPALEAAADRCEPSREGRPRGMAGAVAFKARAPQAELAYSDRFWCP